VRYHPTPPAMDEKRQHTISSKIVPIEPPLRAILSYTV
jgi:hypothetical protein